MSDARKASTPLEDYAFIGDTHTGGLVSRGGSIDWLAFPRFDSPPFFAALLGTEENGRWLLAPAADDVVSERRYREGTLILETDHRTPEGEVRVVDALPAGAPGRVVRLVQGRRGRVRMRMDLTIRYDYGLVVPWVRTIDGAVSAVGGAEGLRLRTPVEAHGEDLHTAAEFTVTEGDEVPFELSWHRSHLGPAEPVDVPESIQRSEDWWRKWSDRCCEEGRWKDAVRDSLVVLKGLSYSPTGGIVAAPTTSLPERFGGTRNWDYRYCWLRDATFTLIALLDCGYQEEAVAWRDWLLRTLGGDPANLQMLYSVAGERRLPEWEVGWLPGYEGSAPVRAGNAATEQFQLDVYGEVMDALHHARRHGIEPEPEAWEVQKVLMDFLEGAWREPDEGIWEVRGPKRHFTHSKVMAWVAFDRAIKAVEGFDLDGPIERWKSLRDRVHTEICERGVDDRGVFTQSYGSKHLDAAVLMIPLVGFLPPDDSRVHATVAAIERELSDDGFVKRYTHAPEVDGMDCGEETFIPCSFWLADNYTLQGRRDEAIGLFERLLGLRNDVGLLSEEYDASLGRLLGNFPQALSHVALVVSATTLAEHAAMGSKKRAEAAEGD